MKRTALIATLVAGLVSAPLAMAQPKGGVADQATPVDTKSQRTRAEVKAECDAARKAGTMPNADCPADMNAKSTRSRAEVKAECAAAQKAGRPVSPECVN